ncbi:hypothetical protein AG4045_023790, partial [Apium graveolens]
HKEKRGFSSVLQKCDTQNTHRAHTQTTHHEKSFIKTHKLNQTLFLSSLQKSLNSKPHKSQLPLKP